MGKAVDLTGKKFGHLTVQTYAGHRKGKIVWDCKCDCGQTVIRDTNYITHGGENISCGCVHHLMISQSLKTHGMSKTRMYKIWEAMKRRCDSPKADRYPHYGGRGIRYCEEWKHFEPFMKWAKNAGYTDDMSIDRIDVNGNYCPENCRWIPMKEQCNNTRQNRYVMYNNEKLSIAQFAERIERPYSAVYQEIYKLRWTVEQCAAHAKEISN